MAAVVTIAFSLVMFLIIAKDRSEVNDNIVIFSGILEDIWENSFSVSLPSVFNVKPIDRGH